ncbi:NIPSNAP family protein [Anaerobaca lacustris]|uniref:NIPSNAP family protein n=1 Tax=Anaerobaca lacustris TaxID=3044600 RepID=A0AAW6TXQ8_9BACT|nr:NIPSNAP family protein [Sedimentisphaerales bacterium M17dextr]
MERREFLRTSCATGLAALTAGATAYGQDTPRKLPGESEVAYRQRVARFRAAQEAANQASMRTVQAAARATDYFELRRYEIETEAQKAGFDAFAKEAAIPALNRAGIEPVGVFYPWEGISPIYVLLRHRSLPSFAALTQILSEDEEFLQAGAAFLNAPASAPAYKRMEVQLMAAFEGMPHLETPIKAPGRVFQLRIYESPSEKTGLKKIEMFNIGEIDIFRKTGLNPVFFGQTLAGEKMPNLTYMLVFNSMDERQANWKRFGSDPDWQALRARPEYADKEILCGITNLYLKPADYSQI